ncbi:hypothetical protein JW710_04150 [Candidatus Dojkabacteria bacterium]|nr:hypothetical protein [Candidatus Dojkabacteria bacterium]
MKGKGSRRPIFGAIVVIVGSVLLLESLGFAGGGLLGKIWPLLVIVLGTSILIKGNTMTGLWIIFFGFLFTVSAWFGWSFWTVLWPSIIIFLGLSILLGDVFKYKGVSSDAVDRESVEASAVCTGVKKNIVSENYKGGDVSAVFGAVELDLRSAKISKSGAKIDVSAIFGGVKIWVPDKCRVVSLGSAALGAWEDKFTSRNDKKLPVLTIDGDAIFGGVEILG